MSAIRARSGDVRRSCSRAERAVEPDRDRAARGVTDVQNASTVWPESVAARRVGDRAGDDQRHPVAERVEGGLDPEDRGLGVERVEDGLDDQQVRAARDQPLGRLLVGVRQLVEGDVPGARVVDVRRDGRGPVGRAERAQHEARPVRVRGLGRGPRPARASRAASWFISRTTSVSAVVGLGDAVGVKVLVSMMSAPASRYAPWIARTMSGRTSESRSLSPAQVAAGGRAKRSPRKSASPSS